MELLGELPESRRALELLGEMVSWRRAKERWACFASCCVAGSGVCSPKMLAIYHPPAIPHTVEQTLSSSEACSTLY